MAALDALCFLAALLPGCQFELPGFLVGCLLPPLSWCRSFPNEYTPTRPL